MTELFVRFPKEKVETVSSNTNLKDFKSPRVTARPETVMFLK